MCLCACVRDVNLVAVVVVGCCDLQVSPNQALTFSFAFAESRRLAFQGSLSTYALVSAGLEIKKKKSFLLQYSLEILP